MIVLFTAFDPKKAESAFSNRITRLSRTNFFRTIGSTFVIMVSIDICLLVEETPDAMIVKLVPLFVTLES